MRKKSNIFQITLSIIFLVSCATTRYMDIKDAGGSRYWGPKEIGITAKKMVGSLYNYLKDSKSFAYLDFTKIRNRTSEHIDTKLLANEISTNLIKKRIKFIDKNKRAMAMKEIELGQSGLIDEEGAIRAGNLKSPNFILSGDVSENLRYVSGKKVQYLVTTLRLTKLATSELVWQEQQKFLKSTKEDKLTW